MLGWWCYCVLASFQCSKDDPVLYSASILFATSSSVRRNEGGKICAGIFKQPMGSKNQVGMRLSYRPKRLYRLAKLNPWNRFLGSLKVLKFGL